MGRKKYQIRGIHGFYTGKRPVSTPMIFWFFRFSDSAYRHLFSLSGLSDYRYLKDPYRHFVRHLSGFNSKNQIGFKIHLTHLFLTGRIDSFEYTDDKTRMLCRQGLQSSFTDILQYCYRELAGKQSRKVKEFSERSTRLTGVNSIPIISITGIQ